MDKRSWKGAIRKGEKTVVITRYKGLKGAPGMPKMLKPSSVVVGACLGKNVALVTDGSFNGDVYGFLVGHKALEAQEGGPIALIMDGDEVIIDAETRNLDLFMDGTEVERRREE